MRITLLRPLFVLALILGIGSVALAQPQGNCSDCACNISSTGFLGQTLYTSASQPVCDANDPVIYNLDANRFGRFWGVPGRRYTFTLCNNPQNTFIFITTNTTIPGVITCADDGCGVPNGPSSQSFVPAVASLYRLYVFNAACGVQYPVGTNVEVMITCTPINPPANNLPCNATPLVLNGDVCNQIGGDNTAATNAGAAAPAGIGNIPVPGCGNYQGADLWYSVQVPASGLIGIQTEESTICAGAFELYTTTNCASGAAFTAIPGTCTEGGITSPNSVPATVFDATAAGLAQGTTVFIRYWERFGNENGAFEICAYEAQRPPNDEPCDAIDLPLDITCTPMQQTFENAIPSTVPTPPCAGTVYNDIWYTFQVPGTLPGNYTGISVNTSATAPVDLAMAWYRLNPAPCDPANLTFIAGTCNASGNVNSQVVNPNLLVAGETIYVRVWGQQPWVGTFDICAVLNQAPANDTPCGAFALPVNYGCMIETYSNSSATLSDPPGAPACGGVPSTDVWFTAVMPATGPLQIDMLAGSVVNAAMQAYTGTCNSLTPIGTCVINGSQQGPGNNQMPYMSITGPAPGTTVYIRVWGEGGTSGTFGICARRTDNPPGNCFYTLTMTDTGGDGWGGSYVTICVAGNCTPYTVSGGSASISFGTNVGQLLTATYTPGAGQQQAQNSFMITQYGQPVYVSSSPPSTATFSETVACDPPPAPAGDCMGAISICTDNTSVPCQPYQPGVVSDLNNSNSGCMNGQQQGVFMILHFGPNTLPCSPAAFDIVGGNAACGQSTSNNIFDFVIWGPYTSATNSGEVNAGNICPIVGQPYRCNWASLSTPTVKGLAFNNSLPTSQFGGGGPMARHMVVNPGDRYLLFVNNWSGSGQQFQVQWKTPPAGFQVLPSDCNSTSPWVDPPVVPAPPGSVADVDCYPLPIELLTFNAQAGEKHVDVNWTTASEMGSSHFNVERSADGEHFTRVGTVGAAGNSSELRDYSFVDDSPLAGLSYYRLEQVDMDGGSKNSQVVPVIFKGGDLTMEVFPNPADEILWLSFEIDKETQLHWRISDASGRLILEERISSTNGRNLFEVPISRLDQGSYMIELVRKDGEQVGISRFVKQ